ncbi:peptidase dimerization domain-containing protein [Bradyrhizobium sp. 18]|uniref:peptidase dimerization domain-containing protein n=1 Tax=Bradyrhizobium sp. 18 TaxID=2782657 RepID=UPI001FFADA5B|nr:peptidase dimerization domain-containing protein [Bradyrhizobium sp. 18]MCK1506522.1 hypothetical protein [Bradyrhizobium sp. 18]
MPRASSLGESRSRSDEQLRNRRSFNVGPIDERTRTNIVLEHAFAEIDLRISDPEIGEKAIARVRELKAYDRDVTIEITVTRNP